MGMTSVAPDNTHTDSANQPTSTRTRINSHNDEMHKRPDMLGDSKLADKSPVASTAPRPKPQQQRSGSQSADDRLIEEVCSRVFDLPPSTAPAAGMAWLPRPTMDICNPERFEKLLLTAGEEAKFGLVNELSTHILIDCLFLTITVAPIYGMQLDDSHTWLERVRLVVFYLTFQIQLVSILLNAITIFTVIEVPSHKFRVWALKRVHNLILCARFHMGGLYAFYVCALLWPLTTVSDPYVALACVLAELAPWAFMLYAVGSSYTLGYLWRLNPIMRLRQFPRHAQVRRAAEEDAQLFADVLSDTASMTASEKRDEATPGWQDVGDAALPLGGVHLPLHHAHHHHVLRSHSHDPEETRALQAVLAAASLPELWPVLARHDVVSVSQLAAADNDDFRAMGVSIGRRLRLQEALREARDR